MKKPDPNIQMELTRARAGMLIDQPFFGTLALRLRLQVMPDEMANAFVARGLTPTLAVDGRTIFYSERFVSSLDRDLLKSAIAHEVMHCVFDHTSRRGARDPAGWNAATDYAINLLLKDAGYKIGDKWLLNPAFAGMSADEIYNTFPPGDGGGGGSGQGPLCDVMPGASDKASQSALENEWKVSTIQAANQAKQQGKLPGNMQRFVEQLTRPPNDWRERLQRFVTEKTKDEYTWARPNRRFLEQGIFLPTLYGERMNCMVVVTDDSGSIHGPLLSAFAAEASAARDAVRPRETIVISCDAAVNYVGRLEADDPFKLENHGGGGTDFRPPFEWLEKEGIKPACLLYITDMYGTFPAQPPDYPVLWCSINEVKAPWGETVHVEIDA